MTVRVLEGSRVGWERKQHAGQPHRSVLIHAVAIKDRETQSERTREKAKK